MTCLSYLQQSLLRVRQALRNPREWFTWQNAVRAGYWVSVRLYGLMLILFMLAIWQLSVSPETTTIWRWLSWMNGPATLILTAIIIGLVQIVAIVLLVIRQRQIHGRCCVKRALFHSFLGFLKLLLFEWTVLNVTALFTSLSFFGLPDLQYSPQSLFIVCVISLLVQYGLFVRYYVTKRRAFVDWQFRDCVLVVLPIAGVFLGAGVVFLVNFVNYPLVDLIRNYLIAGILLCLFFLAGVPFALYTCVLVPCQRRLKSSPHQPGQPETAMAAAVRRELARQGVRAADAESLMLVGLELDTIDGLQHTRALKRLYLSRNRLDGTRGLQGLLALETLHLEDNRIATFLDLLPLRGLPQLRRLALERNPLCLGTGFELEQLVCLLPQLTSVNSMNITPAFRERALQRNKGWLHELLCEHHRSVYEQSMPLLGSFVHAYLTHRATARALQPGAAWADSASQGDRPHRAAYAALLDLKRAFRLRQAHPPDEPAPHPAAAGRHRRGASGIVLAWGSPDFV